ncbi:MAG: hypothetical protein M3393_05600 [Actinomycetota bacterium]|nr:hypothetical protein [Actinomycetota bacterium]
MAKTNTRQFKLDATRPFYAGVGVVDLAVEIARTTATDVQARFSKVELEPKALRQDAKEAQAKIEARVNETVAEAAETYGDLAARGKHLVSRIRRQQATQDAKAAGKTTVAKAKTTRTQTVNAADSSTTAAKDATKRAANSSKTAAKTTKTAAKNTGNTARRNVKATSTSAKKAASATTKATADAAAKVGD